MATEYEFVGDELTLPNGDKLIRHSHDNRYELRGPKGGVRHASVELWVHGMKARSEEQFLSFLNGDDHDKSKCQTYAPARVGKFRSCS